MLLQTVKSRNLWLWGEILKLRKGTSYRDKLLTQIQNLEKYIGQLSEKLVNLNKQNQGQSDEAKFLQKELQKRQEELVQKQNIVSNINVIEEKVNPSKVHEYTTPFKITALQSVDVTWDNPIGESYGITSNFLQSWHNKPVNISFKGISYMGAFGGSTVGNLGKDETLGIAKAANAVASTVTGSINSFTDKIQTALNSNKSGLEAEGKFDPVVDEDIKNISNLLSNYGEGPFTKNVTDTSPYIYLLMENSGGSNTEDGFVTFVGHIKNFTYSERSDKPFLYDFTVQFVGEPIITQKAAEADINAKKDSSNVRLTVVASDSGYSLGYGW